LALTVALADETPPNPFGPGVKIEPAPGFGQPQPQPSLPRNRLPSRRRDGDPTRSATPAEQPVPENTRRANELVKQGIALLAKKRFDEALHFSRKPRRSTVVAASPVRRGHGVAGFEQTAEAARAFERAKKLKPMEPNVHYKLGESYADVGETQKAIDSSKRRSGFSRRRSTGARPRRDRRRSRLVGKVGGRARRS